MVSSAADGGDVFLVNAEGEREDIGDALGLGAGAFRGLSPQSTLAALRRFISRHTTRETSTATQAAQRTRAAPASSDDGEDDDDSSYSWGYHRGRASAAGLFKTATEPTAEGMQLERKGLFGRVRSVTKGAKLADVCCSPACGTRDIPDGALANITAI